MWWVTAGVVGGFRCGGCGLCVLWSGVYVCDMCVVSKYAIVCVVSDCIVGYDHGCLKIAWSDDIKIFLS